MFSGEDRELQEPELARHLDEVDAFLCAASWPTRVGLRIALWFLNVAPILLFVACAPLGRLTIATRVRVLARLEQSVGALPIAFVGWRSILTLVFYENAEELAAIGYPGSDRARYKRALPIVSTEEAAPPLESGVRLTNPESVPAIARSRDVA